MFEDIFQSLNNLKNKYQNSSSLTDYFLSLTGLDKLFESLNETKDDKGKVEISAQIIKKLQEEMLKLVDESAKLEAMLKDEEARNSESSQKKQIEKLRQLSREKNDRLKEEKEKWRKNMLDLQSDLEKVQNSLTVAEKERDNRAKITPQELANLKEKLENTQENLQEKDKELIKIQTELKNVRKQLDKKDQIQKDFLTQTQLERKKFLTKLRSKKQKIAGCLTQINEIKKTKSWSRRKWESNQTLTDNSQVMEIYPKELKGLRLKMKNNLPKKALNNERAINFQKLVSENKSGKNRLNWISGVNKLLLATNKEIKNQLLEHLKKWENHQCSTFSCLFFHGTCSHFDYQKIKEERDNLQTWKNNHECSTHPDYDQIKQERDLLKTDNQLLKTELEQAGGKILGLEQSVVESENSLKEKQKDFINVINNRCNLNLVEPDLEELIVTLNKLIDKPPTEILKEVKQTVGKPLIVKDLEEVKKRSFEMLKKDLKINYNKQQEDTIKGATSYKEIVQVKSQLIKEKQQKITRDRHLLVIAIIALSLSLSLSVLCFVEKKKKTV